MKKSSKGSLTARFVAQDNYEFAYMEIYHLIYKCTGNRISIESALGQHVTYDSIDEFKSEWDMGDIPERYKENNPVFGGGAK